MIARGTAGGREPVGLLFAIDLVVHLQACGWASRGTSDGLALGRWAEAPFGVVAVADQVL